MTREQKIEEIEKITKQISELDHKRDEVRKSLVDDSEFKIGEEVEVYLVAWNNKDSHIGTGFVKDIKVDTMGRFKYHLYKAKTDGTKSKAQFSKFDNLRLEKLA